MPAVFFETFGCQMNVADSEELADALFSRGFFPVEASEAADLVVINTCSVRAHAENRAKSRLMQLCAAKRAHNPSRQIWVIGCMAERLGESLKQEIPGINTVLGARSISDATAHIDVLLEQSFTPGSATGAGAKGISTFVPVMRGCDNYCSYCIVPYVRGPERSLPADEVIEKVRRLVDSGVREVTLLGQNVNSYRSEGLDFADLVTIIHQIDGLSRIRFTTSHPKDCTEKLIRTVSELPRACKHFHLPVQSGSDRILSAMNRKYSRERYLDLIRTIRESMPLADITTDVMVGFPGEADEDYRQTLDLFSEVRFTSAFMFAFSPREGTAAASLSDPVDAETKTRRLTRLVELQTEITKARYAEMIGRRVELLITRRHHRDNGAWMAQDEGCKKAVVSCREISAGTILSAHVTGSSGMTLICEEL